MYGVVFAKKNPAIGPFTAVVPPASDFNTGIELRNVVIHDIICRPTEAPGFAKISETNPPFSAP